MILRFFISLILFLFSYLSVSAVWSETGYFPAAEIALSGANSDVRFDVASALFSTPSKSPRLLTPLATFSGSFYIQGAGWASFSTGTLATTIKCGTIDLSDEPLPNIGAPCTLSGYAWSETIGDIIFDQRVQYLPTSGTLSGKVRTYMGDISLNNVMLPLVPTGFAPSVFITNSGSNWYEGIANHVTPLQIKNPNIYASSGGLWQTKIRTMVTPNKIYSGTGFDADLSLAMYYLMDITDPNKSMTTYYYGINPNTPALTLDSSVPTSFAKTYCTTEGGWDADACPDGVTRKGTVFEHKVGGIVGTSITNADGKSYVDVMMKLRDRYGNSIYGGKLDISYTAPAQLVQSTDSPYFSSIVQPYGTQSLPGSAYFFSGSLFSSYNTFPNQNLNVTRNPYNGADLKYGFKAYAPGKITLNSVKYNGINIGITAPDIEFTPWYGVTSFSPGDTRIGTGTEFTVDIVNNTSRTDITPKIIHGISIGDGLYAAYTDFRSLVTEVCQANQTNTIGYSTYCNWPLMNGKMSPSLFVRSIPSTGGSYSFSGYYHPLIALAYVPPESVVASSYITYQVDGRTIVYPGIQNVNIGSSNYQDLRIRILGQSRTEDWYAGVETSRALKTNFINSVRKNISLLTRNRHDFTTGDITYTGSDIHVTDADLATKKSIIVEGADIYIDGDISSKSHPVSIIALMDPTTRLGGTIHIAPTVRDIHSTLIAERAVESSGDNQLYIFGSVISNNTLGGDRIFPKNCPYFETNICTGFLAKKYDLERIREAYISLPPPRTAYTAASPGASKYEDTSLIIDYDPRVQSDPPPGLSLNQ